MGLAAAQARFLGLTMRKANCEFRSTELAQQKLEITNQLAAIAQDYSNSMNATKLVWSNDALGADVGLSYSLLMMPSIANDYNPYMITTTSGAVVLNGPYLAAARAAGISMAGGNPSADGRDKFMAALVAEGLITQETAQSIQVKDFKVGDKDENGIYTFAANGAQELDSSSVSWNAMAGLGAAPLDKNSSNVLTLTDMILDPKIGGRVVNLLAFYSNSNGKTYVSEDYLSQIQGEAERNKYITDNNDVQLKAKFNVNGNSVDKNKYSIIENGTLNSDPSYLKGLTVADLLSDEVVLMTKRSADVDKTFFADVKAIFENIASMFGYNQTTGVGLNMDEASAKALTNAVGMVEARYLKEGNVVKLGNDTDSVSLYKNSAFVNATTYNRVGGDGKDNGYYAVSLSGMVSAFLTFYDNELRGGLSDYFVGKTLETSNLITDDRSYQFITGSSASDQIPAKEKIADFYDQVYNNICARGWREDASLDDNEYFESSIKNGRYSLTSLNDDGYFYQTRYNETGYLVEEKDADVVARAEAEYTRKKSELTYKEDFIDLKNKNLDAEIAELSTEMDSVKGIISKSIEKTFSMFQQ